MYLKVILGGSDFTFWLDYEDSAVVYDLMVRVLESLLETPRYLICSGVDSVLWKLVTFIAKNLSEFNSLWEDLRLCHQHRLILCLRVVIWTPLIFILIYLHAIVNQSLIKVCNRLSCVVQGVETGVSVSPATSICCLEAKTSAKLGQKLLKILDNLDSSHMSVNGVGGSRGLVVRGWS